MNLSKLSVSISKSFQLLVSSKSSILLSESSSSSSWSFSLEEIFSSLPSSSTTSPSSFWVSLDSGSLSLRIFLIFQNRFFFLIFLVGEPFEVWGNDSSSFRFAPFLVGELDFLPVLASLLFNENEFSAAEGSKLYNSMVLITWVESGVNKTRSICEVLSWLSTSSFWKCWFSIMLSYCWKVISPFKYEIVSVSIEFNVTGVSVTVVVEEEGVGGCLLGELIFKMICLKINFTAKLCININIQRL